jgi:hypothetical protein
MAICGTAGAGSTARFRPVTAVVNLKADAALNRPRRLVGMAALCGACAQTFPSANRATPQGNFVTVT